MNGHFRLKYRSFEIELKWNGLSLMAIAAAAKLLQEVIKGLS